MPAKSRIELARWGRRSLWLGDPDSSPRGRLSRRPLGRDGPVRRNGDRGARQARLDVTAKVASLDDQTFLTELGGLGGTSATSNQFRISTPSSSAVGPPTACGTCNQIEAPLDIVLQKVFSPQYLVDSRGNPMPDVVKSVPLAISRHHRFEGDDAPQRLAIAEEPLVCRTSNSWPLPEPKLSLALNTLACPLARCSSGTVMSSAQVTINASRLGMLLRTAKWTAYATQELRPVHLQGHHPVHHILARV